MSVGPKRTNSKSPTARGTAPSRESSPPGFEFRWKNFKSFVDSDWVRVLPITIFIGSNNSGKSSLFAPLLLLKQTVISGDPTLTLKTSGPLVNTGAFRDLVHGHKISSEVHFDVRFAFPGGNAKPPKRRFDARPGRISLSFRLGDRNSEIVLSKLELWDVHDRLIVGRKRLASGDYSVKFAESLPADIERAVIGAKPEHFFFPTNRLMYALLDSKKPKGRGSNIRFSMPDYFPMVGIAQSLFLHFLSHISYVGPLRQQPKRFYEISGEIPDAVGAQGENAPEILLKRKDQTFVKGIKEWVARFDLAWDIKCETLSPGIFAVRLLGKGAPSTVDFADTGFGLSQILPLIVQGFHGGGGDMIIVEQPEIHLNPKLQCVLADFFASLVSLNKGVIVETHSEHLIMRIRSLIAEGALKPEHVALYFLEPKNGEGSVRRIPIHADGHIEPDEWPKGFFQESLREALSLARAVIPRSGN
jgi:hypothetical protein